MATYASLTQEQKDILGAWERNARGWINTYARLLIEARALVASADASGGARDIVTSLDPGELVPNSSGIAGAHSLTKAEMATMIGFVDEVIANSDNAADRQAFAKAAGTIPGL